MIIRMLRIFESLYFALRLSTNNDKIIVLAMILSLILIHLIFQKKNLA